MASAFIGYTILVTLQHPPKARVQGVVSDVVNQKLFLRDVLLLWTGQRFPYYTLDSSSIADLEIAPSQNENEAATPTTSFVPTPTTPGPPAQFVDPAILSFNKPSKPPQSRVVSNETPVSPIMIGDSAVPKGLRGVSSISSIATTQPVVKRQERRGSTATATLTEPFDALGVNGRKGEQNVSERPLVVATAATTVPAVTVTARPHSQTGPGIIDMKDINHGPLKPPKKVTGKGKGWRSGPFVEEVVPNKTAPPSRKQRGRKAVAEDTNNGWATEDATDIQDMGDFDFETNLSKFDKRRVFDDIRKDDKIAESDRLVSFNRKARPGTNGGKNLHFTENVLDVPEIKDASRWKSEAGETDNDERLKDEYHSSGRGSKRGTSLRRQQQPPSRKGSTHPHLDKAESSPRPHNKMSASSPLLNGGTGSVVGGAVRASFRLSDSNRPCHCVSPLQMLEIEQLCTSELGLTEDMLTENAGRSIAESIFKSASTSDTTNTPEREIRNVLVLVGNHKSGARAIAAARHLRNRRLRVTVCVLGLERGEDSLLEVVRKQLSVYKRGMGYVERWDDYQAKVLAANTPTNNGLTSSRPAQQSQAHVSSSQTPDYVVDALLGVHVTFDELRTDDQATVFEMVKWANRVAESNTTTILSIDMPSGLSGTSGLASDTTSMGVVGDDDTESGLVINSKFVVCLGAPKTGLLNAMATPSEHSQLTEELVNGNGRRGGVWVADIGLSMAAWQKHGSRRKQGTEFGTEWVVGVKLVAS